MVHRLYNAIGRPDLINTPLGENQSIRIKYRDQIDAIVEEWTSARTAEEIVNTLKQADIPCSIVPTFDQVCHDEQLLSRGMITDVTQTVSGKVTVPGTVFKLSKTPGDLNHSAPYLGEHNVEIYSGLLGYSEKQIEEFSNDKII